MRLIPSPIRKAAAAVRSVVTIGLLLVGVPTGLAIAAGWPLPKQLPDVSNMWLAIQQQNIGSDVVIKSVAAVAWLLWAQFAWAVVWEIAMCLPGVTNESRVKRAPFVAPMISGLATRLVAGVLTVGAFTASPAIAAPLPTPTVVSLDAAAPVFVDVSAPTQTVATRATPQTWVVQRGESAWSIAESTFGDGSRFAEILALNPHLTSVRDVVPGITIHLPSDSIEQTAYYGDSAGNEDQIEDDDVTLDGDWRETLGLIVPSFVPEEAIVIEDGDHLWGLSEERLEASIGAVPSDAEVLSYVNAVVEMNADVVEDPNLIYPGEVFTMPQLGVEPVVPGAAPESVQAEEAPAMEPVEPITPAPVVESAPRMSARATPETVASEASLLAAGTPYIAGIAGALVAATGLLALYRSASRRRSVRGEAASARPMADLERSLVAASNMPLMRWAGQELSLLVSQLDGTMAGGPVAVEVLDDGIELLWEIERPEAPHPWEAADGGSAWRLLFDADAPIPDDDLPAGIPALVSVGIRQGGGTVLVDLEAFGSLAVTGDELSVDNVVRALVVELGASEDLANVNVITVGIDLGLPSAIERVRSLAGSVALSEAQSVRDQYQTMIDQTDAGDSFGLRAKTGAGPEALVVVARSDDPQLVELLTLAEPRCGVVLIVAGECSQAGASLTGNEVGGSTLLPLGLRIIAASMPAATATILELALADIPEAEVKATDEADIDAVADDDVWLAIFGEPSVEAEDDTDAEEVPVSSVVGGAVFEVESGPAWERPTGDVIVTLLGEPRVEGHDDLSARQVGLLGLLVCHGGQASPEFVLDHLWADQGAARTRKTLWNLQSAVRRSVGADVLPLSPKDQPMSTTATSDVVIFEALAKRATEVSSAEAMTLLSDALGLIEGAPFNHSQFEWARSIEVYEPVRQMVEAAALRLTELALEAGTIDVARKGLCQGLKALGVNEPLYRARLRVEAHNGDNASVSKVYRELCGRLEDLFGGAAPSEETKALVSALTDAPGVQCEAPRD